MPLSDIVNTTTGVSTGGITQAGYGIPLIISYSTPLGSFTERLRFYTSLTGVAVDFAATTPEYKAASRIFSQNPKVRRIAIGRGLLKPTQRWKLTPTAVNSTDYKLRVGGPAGQVATYTSDSSATVAEITAGLTTAINALTGDTITASDSGTHVVITGNAAGSWDDLEILDASGNTGALAASLLSLEQDHADPGVATDLDQIKLENNEWYGIVNPWNSKAMILAIAGWAESNKKLFIAQTQDTTSVTAAVGGTDVGDELKDAAYARTSAWYHPQTGAFLDAGVVGKMFPKPPGSAAYFYKTIAGVPAYTMTATHQANLNNKFMNHYRTEAGRNITDKGKVAANEWLDVIVGLDQLESWVQEDVALLEFNSDKIPFTDPGIATIQATLQSVTKRAVRQSILAADPEPEVSVPRAADISAADKAARHLPNVAINGTLAGAIHDLDVTINVVA